MVCPLDAAGGSEFSSNAAPLRGKSLEPSGASLASCSAGPGRDFVDVTAAPPPRRDPLDERQRLSFAERWPASDSSSPEMGEQVGIKPVNRAAASSASRSDWRHPRALLAREFGHDGGLNVNVTFHLFQPIPSCSMKAICSLLAIT